MHESSSRENVAATLAAVVGWDVTIPLGAAVITAAIYYARTTPAQRAASRARTKKIEGSKEWQRGPTLMAISVLILIPVLFLPR